MRKSESNKKTHTHTQFFSERERDKWRREADRQRGRQTVT
jgi:hypothetical protein